MPEQARLAKPWSGIDFRGLTTFWRPVWPVYDTSKCTDWIYTITNLFSNLIKSTSFNQLCKFKRTLIVNRSIAKRKGHNKTDWGDKTAGTLKEKKNIIPFFCIPLMQNKMNICEPLYLYSFYVLCTKMGIFLQRIT